jgi:hypothetical protein
VEFPVDWLVPVWHKQGRRMKGREHRGLNLTSLACQLTWMSFGQEPEVPPGGPVDPPGLVGATFGRYPKGPKHYGYAKGPKAVNTDEGK